MLKLMTFITKFQFNIFMVFIHSRYIYLPCLLSLSDIFSLSYPQFSLLLYTVGPQYPHAALPFLSQENKSIDSKEYKENDPR